MRIYIFGFDLISLHYIVVTRCSDRRCRCQARRQRKEPALGIERIQPFSPSRFFLFRGLNRGYFCPLREATGHRLGGVRPSDDSSLYFPAAASLQSDGAASRGGEKRTGGEEERDGRLEDVGPRLSLEKLRDVRFLARRTSFYFPPQL